MPILDRIRRANPRVVALLALVGAYILLASVLSVLRFVGFYDETWDFGIFPQALWSTSHGLVLWEAGDWEFYGVASFFQVHPSLLMFPLAGLYALAPSPFTLLILQAIVTGLAAVPLYLCARRITGSDRKALLTAGLFLVWVPLLSSNLYDFHLESFFPLELFSFFYLWSTGRYAWASVVGVLTSVTLEIGPVLILFFLLFLYYDELLDLFRRRLPSLAWLVGRPSAEPPPPPSPAASRRLRWGIAVGLLAIALYVLLRLLQGPFIAVILGSRPSYAPVWGFSAGSLGLGIQFLPTAFPTKISYWFTVYALLGFIPLLRPRTYILAGPWFLSTLFSSYSNYTQLGFQYGYLVAAPALLGFAYGLERLSFPRFDGVREALRPHGGYLTRRPSRIGVVVGVVIVANLLLSPADPLVQLSAIPEVGPPGYWATYHPGPGYAEVAEVVGLIPTQATVLSSDDLFPFVANHVHAYSTLWYPEAPPHLPFNGSALPDYVLTSSVQLAELPAFLAPYLYNDSDFGVRATVGVTAVGPVTLFELGYRGPTLSLSPISFTPHYYYGAKLALGQARLLNDSNSTYRTAIQSIPEIGAGPFPSTAIWFGPYANLPAGRFVVSLSLHAEGIDGAAPAATTPALWVDASGYATPLLIDEPNVTFGELSAPGWHVVSFPLTATSLVYAVEVRGYLVGPDISIELNYLEIAPA